MTEIIQRSWEAKQRAWLDTIGRLNENAVLALLQKNCTSNGYIRYAMLEIDRLRGKWLTNQSMALPHNAEAAEYLQGHNPWEALQIQKTNLIKQIQELFPEGIISESDAEFLLTYQGWFAGLALSNAGLSD